MNKKILIATVSLLLLTSMICMAGLNLVKADSVTVVSSTGFTDSNGNYNIVGEVQNTGSAWAYALITATISDAHGNVLDTLTQSDFLATLSPNGKAPFEITETTSTIVSQISTYSLVVKSSVSASIPQGLSIIQSNFTTYYGTPDIMGQIQNTGSATATATAIYATFYDSSGKVVDTASGYPDTPDVPAGTTSQFQIMPSDTTQMSLYASYSLIAISDVSISNYATGSTNSASSPTATPTSSSSTTPTPTSSTSSLSTTSATPVTPEFPTITAVTIFMALSFLAVIMLTVRKRKISKK